MKIINNISSATLRIISIIVVSFLSLEMYRRFATNIVIIKEVKICHPSSFVFSIPIPVPSGLIVSTGMVNSENKRGKIGGGTPLYNLPPPRCFHPQEAPPPWVIIGTFFLG